VSAAVEVQIVPLGDLIQSTFALVGPVIGLAVGASAAFLCVRAGLKWFNRIR